MGKLLEILTGYTIWPKKRDPRVKGPQPRVISSAAVEALRRMQGQGKDEIPSVVCRQQGSFCSVLQEGGDRSRV